MFNIMRLVTDQRRPRRELQLAAAGFFHHTRAALSTVHALTSSGPAWALLGAGRPQGASAAVGVEEQHASATYQVPATYMWNANGNELADAYKHVRQCLRQTSLVPCRHASCKAASCAGPTGPIHCLLSSPSTPRPPQRQHARFHVFCRWLELKTLTREGTMPRRPRGPPTGHNAVARNSLNVSDSTMHVLREPRTHASHQPNAAQTV